MRFTPLAAILLAALASSATAQDLPNPQAPGAAPAGEQPSFEEAQEQASYAIGMNIAQNLKGGGMELQLESLVQGLRDAYAEKDPAYSEEQLQQAFTVFQQEMQSRAQKQQQEQAAEGAQEAKEFLAANKQKEGVQELPSGLQYKVLEEGTGESPKATDTVKVHYHGTLPDGTVFDSSVERGEPIDLPLNGVIEGWTQGVTRMKVGGKWRLFVPPELAYGENPRPGGPIGPNQLLIFDIELLDIGEPMQNPALPPQQQPQRQQ